MKPYLENDQLFAQLAGIHSEDAAYAVVERLAIAEEHDQVDPATAGDIVCHTLYGDKDLGVACPQV